MPCPFLIFSQSDYLIQVVDTNSNTEWQTVQLEISWLQKPTDLDPYCLQSRVYPGSAGQGLSKYNELSLSHAPVDKNFQFEITIA